MAKQPDHGLKTNFAGATLVRTVLRGVDLRGVVGLTTGQIEEAIIDENTRLPEYLLSHKRGAKVFAHHFPTG